MEVTHTTGLATACGGAGEPAGRAESAIARNLHAFRPNVVADIDVDQVSDDFAAELLRHTEVRLMAIFDASVAMDQRAAVLGAGFMAASAALAAIACAVSDRPIISWPAAVAAICLAIAAILGCYVMRPQTSHFPGIDPQKWVITPGMHHANLKVLRMAAAGGMYEMIERNEAAQRKNAGYLLKAMQIGAVAPIFGLAALAIAYWIFR